MSAFVARARLAPEASGLGVGVYSRLLRGRLQSALEDLLPRSARLLGVERVARVVEHQLARGSSTSPLFRHVGAELAQRITELARDDPSFPPQAAALAHYEWLRFAVASAEGDDEPVLPWLGTHGVSFARATALVRLPFLVHELDCRPGDARLFLHRTRSSAVAVHALSEPMHALLLSLWNGASLAEAVATMEGRYGADAERCHACASLLADLAESGALRGRRSAAS